jgi:hypothetical protein
MQEPTVGIKLVRMMALSQALSAAKSMVPVNAEMVDAVPLGLTLTIGTPAR